MSLAWSPAIYKDPTITYRLVARPGSYLERQGPTFTETLEAAEEKLGFHDGFTALFKNGIFTDIKLKPGGGGHRISAHRCVLAARSEIFRNMLDSDSCKSAPDHNDTITIPELNHDELWSLLEFLYSGNLSPEKLDKHVYTLAVAADKYEIAYLTRVCERHMVRSLNTSNVLTILEMADSWNNQQLMDAALLFVVKDMEGLVLSAEFESFVHKNPHLAVRITGAFFTNANHRAGRRV